MIIIQQKSTIRNWFDNIGGKRADEQIIASYVQEENFEDALTLAGMLPQLYNYDYRDLEEYNLYMEMLSLEIQLRQEGRGIGELDSTEVSNLVFIAGNSNSTAGSMAKGILETLYGYHYCNCLNVSDTLGYKSSGMVNPEALAKVYGFDVNVEPNPAKDWVAFNYTLPGKETEGLIKVSDVSSKLVTTMTITGAHGQKVWDTREINSGVYFYTFNVSEFSKSGKIVISK